MTDRHEIELRLMDALADLWGHGLTPEGFVEAVENNLFYATGKAGWHVEEPGPNDRSGVEQRGLPETCCCPIVFGSRVTAGHCPIHGAAVLGRDGAAEAHAIDRRERMGPA